MLIRLTFSAFNVFVDPIIYPQDTYEFGNLEEFHGTGGLNITKWDEWDSILTDMLQRPADVVVVSARRRGRGHGGWSKDNPYMEDVRI
jgi:hypothetical protein